MDSCYLFRCRKQGKRFKLNSSTRSSHFHQNRHNSQPVRPISARTSPSGNWSRGGQRPVRQEFTAYIGDMTTDMEDESFLDLFRKSYPSVFAARIMRTPDGMSKNFAFVRFSDEAEYAEALNQEERISALLRCPIRICKAHPRPPRRWPRPSDHVPPAPQLIDPSGKFQSPPSIRSVDSQRRNSPSVQQPQSQPLAAQPHSAQPLDQMQAYYYIPMPGYTGYSPDPAFWSNQWHEMYPSIPMSDGTPAAQQAYSPMHPVPGVPEAGDTANLHLYHSYPRPMWQMPTAMHQPHHFLPDPRFYFCAADVPDLPDTSKDPSSAKADMTQVCSNCFATHAVSHPVLFQD